MEKKLYDTQGASDLLKSWGVTFSPGTLANWRKLKVGPEFEKIMGKVFYTEAGLLRFINRKRRVENENASL